MNQISDRPGPSWNVGMLLSGIALLVGIATLIPFPDVIRRMFGSEEKFRRKTEELRKEAEVRADEWEKTFDKIEALKRKADALGPFPGEKGATEASSLREKGNPIRVGWNVQEVETNQENRAGLSRARQARACVGLRDPSSDCR